jgi:hypothetical protein
MPATYEEYYDMMVDEDIEYQKTIEAAALPLVFAVKSLLDSSYMLEDRYRKIDIEGSRQQADYFWQQKKNQRKDAIYKIESVLEAIIETAGLPRPMAQEMAKLATTLLKSERGQEYLKEYALNKE